MSLSELNVSCEFQLYKDFPSTVRLSLKESFTSSSSPPPPINRSMHLLQSAYPSRRACSAELMGAEGILNVLLAL